MRRHFLGEKLNFFPNHKILGWSKLRAFANVKINVTEKIKFLFGRVRDIVGKGGNAGYQHFLLFPHCFFKRLLFQGVKIRDLCGKVLTNTSSWLPGTPSALIFHSD